MCDTCMLCIIVLLYMWGVLAKLVPTTYLCCRVVHTFKEPSSYLNMCTCSEGERSLENEQFTMMDTPAMQILDASVPVEPFDIEERVKSIHERRRRETCPSQDNIRYVLFILDTSGSIGRSQFVRVKYLLALMSEKLCDHLRVAMITYGSDINLEFCFNCHTDRCEIFNAITRVQYRGGATRTTDATKCACQTLLTEQCGLPDGRTTSNIDIVYLTDGGHNGPCKSNLANEVNCFHSRPNINTYAIAIGEEVNKSVQALENQRNTDDLHVFNMRDFDELQEMFDTIMELLDQEDSNGDPVFDCVSHNHVPCRSGWPEADKTAALLLEAYEHTCTSFTHFTTCTSHFWQFRLTTDLCFDTAYSNVPSLGSIQSSANIQSASYAVVTTLAVLCLLCWLIWENAEFLFVLLTTVTPVRENNHACCLYGDGL